MKNEKNISEAQCYLGKRYYLDEDYEQAVHWLTKAAEQNHAEAQYYLGKCYDNGYGIPQNREHAAELTRKAAEQGLAIAQFSLGCCYCNNISGVKADAEQSAYWFAKAAEQGFTGEHYNKTFNEEHDLKNAARFRRYREQLDKLNLKTIDDLENLLKPLLLDAAKLTVKRAEMPEETQLKSHFGGQPYFEKGEEWPENEDGEPLHFVFQFFNTKGKYLPDNIKLIQFYYDFEEKRPWFSEDDGWLVKVYEQLDKDNMITIEKPEELWDRHYCEIKTRTIKSLPHWYNLEMYDKNADMLCDVLEEENPYWKVTSKLKAAHNLQSQVGGYPHWLQGSAHPKDKDFIFLFQIDSEDEAGLMWGDCGLVYAYYNPKTKETKFELQCC